MTKAIILTGYAEWATPVVRTDYMDVFGHEHPREEVVYIHDRAYVFKDKETELMDLHTGECSTIQQILTRLHE